MGGRAHLRDDTRGAVMLVGVFMAAFLVGVLWYVIGLGDAVLYRERMQDGADAAAFAAAVYQARGMNLIAMLNLVMAAVLAVLVALKVAQVLLIAANLISCALWMLPVCGATGNAMGGIQTAIYEVEPAVDKILRGLYITESAIAVGMPWVAEGKAILVAKDYGPTVHGGLMVSLSLVPGHLTRFLGDIDSKKSGPEDPTETRETKVVCSDDWVSSCDCHKPQKRGCCSHHGGLSGSCTDAEDPPPLDPEATPGSGNSNEGVRWGLPVEDDSYSFLCKKAGQVLQALVFYPIKHFVGEEVGETIKKLIGGLLDRLTQTFPGYFCGDGGVDMGALKSDLRSLANQQCDDQAADAAKEAERRGEPAPIIDPQTCKDAVKDHLARVHLPSGTPVGKKVSKKVYSDAQNGDNYFASWAVVWGDLRDRSGADKGVNIAAWGKKRVADPSFLSRFHFAKSEYYYEPKSDRCPASCPRTGDCRGCEWDSGNEDESLVEEAMWNMRWRARLRRSYLPPLKLGAAIADHFHEWVAGKLGDELGEDSPVVEPIADLLSEPAERLGGAVDDYVGEKVGNINEGIIH